MILRGAQIQRDGHGRCGLLPNRTLSSNRAEWPSSAVLEHTGPSLCDHVVSPRHSKPGGAALVRLSGPEIISCDSSKGSRGTFAAR